MTNASRPEVTFQDRHIGPSADDIARMTRIVGVPSVDVLIDQAMPANIRRHEPLALGAALSEAQLLDKMQQVASRNRTMVSLIGQGYYDTLLPPVIQRNVLENPAWYTSYTPYQPEISQGRLEALLNFQTMVIDLTGLPIANASLLDEATAAAEAMAMAHRIAAGKPATFFVDHECHPQTIAVVRTRAEPLGWTVTVGDPARDLDPAAVFGALLQYPGTTGALRDDRKIIAALKDKGAVAVMAADPLALTLLTPPGELGADIAIGSMQRFGVPMGYGGPHAAYIATKTQHQRSLPGRLVGATIDKRGRLAYRLALQTREQHIRRDKATSNICTAQALLAIIASMYGVYHGPEGLRHIARRVATHTAVLAKGLVALGWPLTQTQFFDTVTVRVPAGQDAVLARAVAAGLNLRRDSDALGISCDETTTPEIVARIWEAFGAAPGSKAAMPRYDALAKDTQPALPQALHRTSAFMAHPVFHKYRSETEMLRYLRRLSDRDLALDRTMIPLGSCTMKLNATAEMMPLTWAGFAQMHPFAPDDQAQGYAELFDDLKAKLVAVSGYDAVSLQPNSGAQGEYAGLLAIRAYHRSRGDAQRTICLIPTSAHGTNPASAQMVGMTVVTVACDSAGNVDVADLERKAAQSGDRLAALMITYPSTHGVFETAITNICEIIHAHGGQVYLDGANLNALVGLARPGDCGADVSHFNLHKTFCIPHGGGGPGMGPIGVKKHLAPFLPGDPRVHDGSTPAGPVSAAPFGSASILTIAWAYILMMGGKGLTDATKIAILNANYIAQRLQGHYPLLFRGENGRVAHECIIDIRGFKETSGVTVDDVAKRLIDYGFHAPTMSFPVAGTLMIEPTESESLAEIDRFCDAMIAIRDEIRSIESGTYSRDDNPLRNAPHTLADLVEASWSHGYSREVACLPGHVVAADKYWSPVNRIDGVHGDRNLICSCPPLESYSDTVADAPMLQAAK
ncbi:MAG: aminomethyl-transferring glycine dehydrogenase [Rhizobiales bacterium]|nr:aminomethyl-transferring glycine dehydrogenase [Hyphomicrobiales bacterium]OJY45166.1 MAG: glycine dehydrogenase (aminomethyl-transferring) [Rhizobiales bacterium 64-17]